MNSRTKKRKKHKKKWKRIVLFFMTLFIIGSGLYLYNVYSSMVSAVDKMHQPISRDVSDKREEKVEPQQKDPLSILLVGVDEREGDGGRTDSMLVITINPEEETTKIVSIPRDTRAKLVSSESPKKNTIDKMNHAYAFGGIEMTIESVETFLNIPIDYYAEVNMQGFKDIVDAVGGIDVYNEYSFELDGVTLSKGEHHLNGEEALGYARMRKQDPLGDFGRQARQREVIEKVIDKGVGLSTLTNYDELLEALQNNIKTNLTLKEIVSIQKDYKNAAKNIEKVEIVGNGKTLNDGIWYFLVEDEERQNLSDQLRAHLGLSESTVASSTASVSNN